MATTESHAVNTATCFGLILYIESYNLSELNFWTARQASGPNAKVEDLYSAPI